MIDLTGMFGYMSKGMGGMFPGFFLFGGVLGVLLLAFWVWMLVDCVQRKFKDKNEKVVWVLVILFAKILGAVIYFFVVRARDKK
ncbi:MAG: hypothetical protein CMH63_02305 [Nanoarchaeota archaeon]|jgi:uncharacterized integral membrane protein|nr:hypothetical protein [Nanoarchaeota archaeon]|tara:strand:- start:12205 stop:12456 length:252 start_codon:yes stop_codon:yes gene_type:complete